MTGSLELAVARGETPFTMVLECAPEEAARFTALLLSESARYPNGCSFAVSSETITTGRRKLYLSEAAMTRLEEEGLTRREEWGS